jgi:hypothetical protein
MHVAPPELDRLRLTGDRNIAPDDLTKEAIDLSRQRAIGSFRLCVDPTGHVSNVIRLRTTRFDKYDQTIERTMRTWTYRPYLVAGTATPVCTDVTYIYSSDDGPGMRLCDPRQIDDDVMQAANEFANGQPADSLALIRGALECKPDALLYRSAAIYACAAHDGPAAREMFAKVAAPHRASVEQKCTSEGISLAP